jgi:uncharacterized protein YkwD
MKAARDHARDIGPKGIISHQGSSGSTLIERLKRYARQVDYAGEAISFGPDRAETVVAELVIDDGVPDRGHRKILLNGRFRYVGVACGPHRKFRTVCVIDFAGTYMPAR